jgi:hypothetical protein
VFKLSCSNAASVNRVERNDSFSELMEKKELVVKASVLPIDYCLWEYSIRVMI